MNMRLVRQSKRKDGIYSELFDDQEIHFCFAVTEAILGVNGYEPVIYDGTFTCKRGTHRLEHGVPFETFEITGVEGHTGLLFHKLNLGSQSKGCEGLGEDIVPSDKGWFLQASEAAFDAFMALQKEVDEFTLTVE